MIFLPLTMRLGNKSFYGLALYLKINLFLKSYFCFGVFYIRYRSKGLFQNIDADIVFAELFHPFIRKNHGGADGQFRFWGRYYESDQANNLSTSHSLILKKEL